MAANLQQRINNIEAKASLLTERYAAVRKLQAEGLAKIEELTAQVKSLEREIQKRDAEIERLKVGAAVTATSRDDVELSRKFISELVREIDKCIAQFEAG